jgi:putative restriction endonuclease
MDEANRTNPQNGLCMNYLFHKAYDEYLLGISPDYDIIISDKFFGEKLKDVDSKTLDYVRSFNNRKIIMPKRFLPNRDLLADHFTKFKQQI